MPTARRLRVEVVIVLGLSLGASAVYSIVSLLAKLTEERALGDQTVALNPSRSTREWLDFTYQFLDVFFGLFAVGSELVGLWLWIVRVPLAACCLAVVMSSMIPVYCARSSGT